MKHATKQEASAARLAALKASRDRRTYAKHARWAEEMRAAGWQCDAPLSRKIVDSRGVDWELCPDRLYRTVLWPAPVFGWPREKIAEAYGIKEEI